MCNDQVEYLECQKVTKLDEENKHSSGIIFGNLSNIESFQRRSPEKKINCSVDGNRLC
jgi:hypothetical protein